MIHLLLGTRAQIIKMAPVMHLLQERGIEYNFIFMAQHRETVYEMLDDFSLKHPDYVLGNIDTDIVSSARMVFWSCGVLASGIRDRSKVFRGDKQGIVLIHGDAPPLFLGAIMARIQGLQVASIEAGLRSFNLLRPFPEELVRVVTGKLGLIDIHFCQDDAALRNAGRYAGRAVNTSGNTILDAIQLATKINNNKHPGNSHFGQEKYAVVTLHRYETISRKRQLSKAIDLVLRISKSINIKFIMHPPTKAALHRVGLYHKLENSPGVNLSPRLNFIDFQALISNAEFLVTDGGSNQEESYYMGIPCLLFRSETERSEGLDKNVVLSSFDAAVIDDFVSNYKRYRSAPVVVPASPSQRIVDEVVEFAD
jgi:UDP-N-acetylglucosamine 2-epimerase (non-hydrolysing)